MDKNLHEVTITIGRFVPNGLFEINLQEINIAFKNCCHEEPWSNGPLWWNDIDTINKNSRRAIKRYMSPLIEMATNSNVQVLLNSSYHRGNYMSLLRLDNNFRPWRLFTHYCFSHIRNDVCETYAYENSEFPITNPTVVR